MSGQRSRERAVSAWLHTRAFLLWGLLVGQAVLTASYATGIGAAAWLHGPHAPWVILAVFAGSGIAGVIGETVWRRSWSGCANGLFRQD